MNTKQEIINKINRIDDPDLLLEIDRWISSILNSSVSEDFSKEEIDAVHEGCKQFEAGDTLDQKEAKKLFIDWLQKKRKQHQESSTLGYSKEFVELYGSVKDKNFKLSNR